MLLCETCCFFVCFSGEDYRQKWEDEIDAGKTWKRKHANNVKVRGFFFYR